MVDRTRSLATTLTALIVVSCGPPAAPLAPVARHSDTELLADSPIPVEATRGPELGKEADLLARVVCAECKGCASSERVAIAHVALNRASRPSWWGHGLEDVLTKPSQFATSRSPLCRDDLPPRQDGLPWSPGWVQHHRDLLSQIRFEALMVLEGERDDPTNGAVYFHAKRLGDIWDHLYEVSVPGAWRHRFFRDKG
jgi:hypothetical protein